MRGLASLGGAAALLLGVAAAARGGTGGGNEFITHENAPFDFRLASPNDWACDGCSRADGARSLPRGVTPTSTVWFIHAPVAAASDQPKTWMRVTFIDNDPATSEDTLKAELPPSPSGAWTEIDRGGFTGWGSSPLQAAANNAVEYYLVTADGTSSRVIRLEWQKDPSDNGEALQLDAVIDSVDRRSDPPKIKEIHSDKKQAYKVGDQACLAVAASDIQGKLDAASLSDFQVKGQLPHWSFKSIRWDQTQGVYTVCVHVTSSFGPDGLQVSHLALSLDDGDRGVDCVPDTSDATTLVCTGTTTFGNIGVAPKPPLRVKPVVAMVDNPTPDLEGPVIRALEVDAKALTLTFAADDASGVESAVVGFTGQALTVYPDELASGRAVVSIAVAIHEGWNTIDQIQIYDKNGVPTLYRRHGAGKASRRAGAFAGETYEMVSWKGEVTMSSVPVVTFLKGGGAQ